MRAATDLAMALDRVAFAQAVGIESDRWQEDLLRSKATRVLLNCARQSGKSTVAGVLAVHAALYESHSLVLLLSYAQAIPRALQEVLEHLPRRGQSRAARERDRSDAHPREWFPCRLPTRKRRHR